MPVQVGVIVTNTTFTPDAAWIAGQYHGLVRLRDAAALQRWIHERFTDDALWRELPDTLEVCPGVIVQVPKPIGT